MPAPAAHHFDVRPTPDSHFAWLRTRMSSERTLMSWLRTALAMIGFGFTIVQFFERLGNMQGATAALRPEAPRYVGLALIAAGTIALMISTWQYHALRGYLWSDAFQGIAPDRPGLPSAYWMTIILLGIGILLFVAAAVRLI